MRRHPSAADLLALARCALRQRASRAIRLPQRAPRRGPSIRAQLLSMKSQMQGLSASNEVP